MFIPLPMQVIQSRRNLPFPLANACLIALNVLAYLLLDPQRWWVGPNTSPISVLSYGFVHNNVWHLIFNMWFLWVIGNAVNRRIGDGYYLLAYLGTIVILGLLGRICSPYHLLGSSGAVFAVMAMAALLLPGARVLVHYLALFPVTVLMGLIHRPQFGLHWIIRWGTTQLAMLALVALFAVLETTGLLVWGISWTSLGHLMGLVCGVAIVLLMPTEITMGYASKAV
jgi:membrane associated rhomboid family serine protease